MSEAPPAERIVVIDAGSPLMATALAVRHAVFVLEQGVPPELERDDLDEVAIHLAALCGDRVVGTLRIVADGASARIGRMAVLAPERNCGIGSRLMDRAVTVARSMGVNELVLHAQLAAKPFYARLGYCEEGALFEEAGIPHIAMRKWIAARRA